MAMILLIVVMVWKQFQKRNSSESLLNETEKTSLGLLPTSSSQEQLNIYAKLSGKFKPIQKYKFGKNQEQQQQQQDSFLENQYRRSQAQQENSFSTAYFEL